MVDPIKLSDKRGTDPASLPWDSDAAARQLIWISQNSGGGGWATKIASLEEIQTLMNDTFADIPSSGENAGRMLYVSNAFGSGNPGIAVFKSATEYEVFSQSFFDMGFFYPGTPTEGSVVFNKVLVTRPITFPADFAGSYGHVSSNPAAQYDIDVQVNGSSIGTISIATNGVFTFTTTGNTAKNVNAGQRVEFIAPAGTPSMPTIVDIAATLVANLRMTG